MGPSLIGPLDIHNTDAIHPISPHTQAYENNDLSSSIIVDPTGSQNSSGGKKPRAQASISGDPNRLSPSVRRDSLGGGSSSQTHEWDGDHGLGGVQDWINSGPDYIPKRTMAIMAPELERSTPINVDPHQHEAQEHHDENDNMEKASQQRNSETSYNPIVSQANPLPVEDENRAGRENVSKHDHRESRKVRRIKI